MRNLSSQFNLVTNMKAKPNSQGTLFQVDPSARTPESRQPRGYSPERLQAVKEAVGPITTPREEAAARQAGDTSTNTRIVDRFNSPEQRRAHLYDALARSSAPIEHMQHPTHWFMSEHTDASVASPLVMGGSRKTSPAGEFNVMPAGSRPANPERGTPGHSWPEMRSINIFAGHPDSPHSHMDPAETRDGGRTVLHELGHAVSHMQGNPHAIGNARDPGDRGNEEGFADAYADQHARLPGYKRKPALGDQYGRAYAWKESYNLNTHEADDFAEHYNATRHAVARAQNRALSAQFAKHGHVDDTEELFDSWDYREPKRFVGDPKPDEPEQY